MTIILLAIAAGVVALLYGALLTMRIVKSDRGSETVQAIGQAIQEGAMAFMSREYRLLAIFVVIMFAILTVFIDLDLLNKIPGESESVPKTGGHPCVFAAAPGARDGRCYALSIGSAR